VGWNQLGAIKRGSQLQFLLELDKEWRSDDLLLKRKAFVNLLMPYLKSDLDKLNDKSWRNVKVAGDEVLDFFEKIAFGANEDYFPKKAVYELYSYCIFGYWQLIQDTKYLDRIKSEQQSGEDIYDQLEKLIPKLREYQIKKLGDQVAEFDDRLMSISEVTEFCEEERS
jgi:hypothetical protein